MSAENRSPGPWRWIPTLYFAEGLPYVVVMTVAVVLYKRMGVSNAEIALYTSWLYLPWVIKPFWSPFVDLMRTKRFWILAMQLLIGAGLGGIALTIPAPGFLQWTLLLFWLMAFSSATHDIAADGFYMIGLNEQQQAFFVGIRSTFYRFAMIAGQGLLIMLAGALERGTGLAPGHVEVTAAPDVTLSSPGDPAVFPKSANGGRVHFEAQALQLPLGASDAERARETKRYVSEWNARHGFVPEPAGSARSKQREPEVSWWTRNVSGPLGRWLAGNFGQERAEADTQAGAIAVVRLRVDHDQHGTESVTVALERASGNKNLKLVSSDTLRFTPDNVERHALVAIQVDPRQSSPIRARFEARAGNVPFAWSLTFFALAGTFLGLFVWHRFAIPKSANDVPARREGSAGILAEFGNTFVSFFRRRDIGLVLAFLLLYRFGEAQLVKLAAPFLLDGRQAGGLGLSTAEVGFAYGTVGVLALTIGGILGGLMVSKHGLKRWLLPMVAAINLPNAVYIYLAATQPDSFTIVNACIAVEQFGYGFGFTAYMMYMILVAQGPQKTAHFAITTGFMALGMMIPGMFSGWLQEALGYRNFFVWVLIATIPGFLVAALVKIDPGFGRKEGPAELGEEDS